MHRTCITPIMHSRNISARHIEHSLAERTAPTTVGSPSQHSRRKLDKCQRESTKSTHTQIVSLCTKLALTPSFRRTNKPVVRLPLPDRWVLLQAFHSKTTDKTRLARKTRKQGSDAGHEKNRSTWKRYSRAGRASLSQSNRKVPPTTRCTTA